LLRNDIKTCFVKVFVEKMSRVLSFFSCSRVRVVNDFYGGREILFAKEVVWASDEEYVVDGSGCAGSRDPRCGVRRDQRGRVPEIQKRAGSVM
jgi:hypothetical protein